MQQVEVGRHDIRELRIDVGAHGKELVDEGDIALHRTMSRPRSGFCCKFHCGNWFSCCAQVSGAGAGSMAASGQNKLKIKLTGAHRGLRLTCTHWDYCPASHSTPSWLLTCLLTPSDYWEQMLLDARRQGVAHPAALVECGATIDFEAHDRAEQSLSAAGITGQRPPQKAESP
jgi:hypothetical protein